MSLRIGTRNRRTDCPLHGCKRMYTDSVALDRHIKDHEIPAESVPGKVLLCSSIGCSGSFPDMQKLMQHMRHHHKPNIFFLCESCRAKLRSYRGLLTHLHTCSKVSRAKLRTEQMQVQAPSEAPPDQTLAASENWSNEQAAPQGDSAVGDMQVTSHSQHVDNPLASPPHPDQRSTPLMDSQEPLSFQQPNQEPSQFHLQTQDFGVFPSPDAEMLTADPLPFDGQAEHQGQSQAQSQFQAQPPLQGQSQAQSQFQAQPPLQGQSQAQSQFQAQPPPQGQSQAQSQFQAQPPLQGQSQVQPQPQSAPQSPTFSAAVWKKNQGPPGHSRILWEHTRGRYTCVQCNLSLPNRKAMTAHIHTEHKTPKEN
ncbi:Zinc finger protein 414 [Merluccius polli]|uniref:Zinc finger protein 414 n=1 Tax=Merluccius polli TaxID=89951 RepID=A0AA47NP69_MERPO|nr:Zinc finger protein 414 [Merluccius polli]